MSNKEKVVFDGFTIKKPHEMTDGGAFLSAHGEEAYAHMSRAAQDCVGRMETGMSHVFNKLKARTLNLIEAMPLDDTQRSAASKLFKGFCADAFNDIADNNAQELENQGIGTGLRFSSIMKED